LREGKIMGNNELIAYKIVTEKQKKKNKPVPRKCKKCCSIKITPLKILEM